MGVDFSFSDDFEQQILDAARQKAGDHMLDIARQVQSEMGAEAASLRFEFVVADGDPPFNSSNADLGRLEISGANNDVCQRFAARLRERMGR